MTPKREGFQMIRTLVLEAGTTAYILLREILGRPLTNEEHSLAEQVEGGSPPDTVADASDTDVDSVLLATCRKCWQELTKDTD